MTSINIIHVESIKESSMRRLDSCSLAANKLAHARLSRIY